MKTYIGIDPGYRGAVAVLQPCGALAIVDIPILSVGTKTDYDMAALVDIFVAIKSHNEDIHVALEKVHAMPQQGVTSMFSLGRGRGILEGILAALLMPYTMLDPRHWQRVIGVSSADKHEHYLRAVQLFPDHAGMLSRNLSGRSDALLLAATGRQKNL